MEKKFTPTEQYFIKSMLISLRETFKKERVSKDSRKKLVLTYDHYPDNLYPEDYEQGKNYSPFIGKMIEHGYFTSFTGEEKPLGESFFDGSYLEYQIELVPVKLFKALVDFSVEPKYYIKILRSKHGDRDTIVLNGKYFVHSFQDASMPHDFFEIVYENPETQLTKSAIKSLAEKKYNKKFSYSKTGKNDEQNKERTLKGIINGIGFKKPIKKIFFPIASENAIFFKREVFLNEVEKMRINVRRVDEEIKNFEGFSSESTK